MFQSLNKAPLSLIDRIRSDIRTYGDEKTFHAVWRQVSPESVELVDYLPSDSALGAPNDICDVIQAMPAWQILKVLQTQMQPH